ncbi:MAG TPA: hypothetical protein VMV04_07195 [Thermodesulfobacteriota bacterium]|nr:hypothetical protein [Thermodesulfobacteriota bacterium]
MRFVAMPSDLADARAERYPPLKPGQATRKPADPYAVIPTDAGLLPGRGLRVLEMRRELKETNR